MGRFSIQQCVITTTVRQYGPHPTTDLLGVDYSYTVPADTEFPRIVKLELFLRAFAENQPSTKIQISVARLYPDGTEREQVYRQWFDLPFPNQPGRVVLDRGFKLMNVRLSGEGLYSLTVQRPRRVKPKYDTGSGWKDRREWRILAVDYFAVWRIGL